MSIREPRILERLFTQGVAFFGAYGLGAITMLGLMAVIGMVLGLAIAIGGFFSR